MARFIERLLPAPHSIQAKKVITCGQIGAKALSGLLGEYGLTLISVPAGQQIPGSYWGEPEAGLIGRGLYVLDETPVHSALHEACHWICMDERRRAALHTDAGGGFAEEDAVCFLQILLSDLLPGYDREQQCTDMDAWGYSFRLGSARAWFERDAEDAHQWLLAADLVDGLDHPIVLVRP